MLSLEKLLDVVKELLRFIRYGNKIVMFYDASSANADPVNIPSSCRSFIITNLGANGASSSYSSYTLTDSEGFTETVPPSEIVVTRNAGGNNTFLKSYIATPASGHQLKVVYLK